MDQHLRAAASQKASNVHFEPKDDHVRVRYRIEGVLQERKSLPLSLGIAVVSRLKMLAKMDMAERRIPQDGNFSTVLEGSERTVRASVFPSVYGEKLVLQIANAAMALKDLHSIGIPEKLLPIVTAALARPSGLILTTGPAGSGKTATLYSMIQSLDAVGRNIVTLEDGIEIRMPNLTQGETNARAGFTFGTGLRAIEGQDPDAILVGELGDVETAAIAFRCALTGRLVLSTLYAASTVEAITRLLDMGIEPFAVSSGLSIIIAQRLVRRLRPVQEGRPRRLRGDRVPFGFMPEDMPKELYRPSDAKPAAAPATGAEWRSSRSYRWTTNCATRSAPRARPASSANSSPAARSPPSAAPAGSAPAPGDTVTRSCGSVEQGRREPSKV